MSRPIVRIVESEGTFIDREMNDAEFQQYELDQIKGLQRIAEAEAKAEAKATAQAKLAALGLTVEDLQALGL
jgi:hypothetical protein